MRGQSGELAGGTMRIWRVLITAGCAVVLFLCADLAGARAAVKPAYPAVLSSFNPNGLAPGHWYLVRKTGVLYLNSGLLAGCHSAGVRWQRQDGTQIRLVWASCTNQQINQLRAAYDLSRAEIPAAWQKLGALGADVDLVRAGPGGQVWRFWLQGDLSLALVSLCHRRAIGACAGLTARAA